MFKFMVFRLLKNAFKGQKQKLDNLRVDIFTHASLQAKLSITTLPQAKGNVSPSIKEGIMFRSGFFQDFLQFLSSPISLIYSYGFIERLFSLSSLLGHFPLVSILIIFVSIFIYFLVLYLSF